MTFHWTERYATGIPRVDAQHQTLIRIINEVFEILCSDNPEEIDASLVKLGDYITEHFALEEAYMVETAYPEHAEHKEAHASFAARIADLREGCASKRVVALRAGFMLSEWLQDHLLKEDKHLFAHVKRVR
jgi:hemerythrin